MSNKYDRHYPAIPLRNVTVFPGMVMHFDVSRKKSVKAVEASMAADELIYLVTQRDSQVSEPGIADLYTVGTIAKIKQIIKMPGKILRVQVEGLEKALVNRFEEASGMMLADVRVIEGLEKPDKMVSRAIIVGMRELLTQYAHVNPKFAKDTVKRWLSYSDAEKLMMEFAQEFMMDFDKRQQFLEAEDYEQMYTFAATLLVNEINAYTIKEELGNIVRERVDKNQKDYILREELAAINEELDGGTITEAEEYEADVEKLDSPQYVKDKLKREIKRLKSLAGNNAEANVERTYIETCLELPWNVSTEDNKDIDNAAKVLDSDHYGMKDIKERILESLAVRNITGSGKAPVICLAGPPGTGKTLLALAAALGKLTDYKQILLARPVVALSNKDIGFLPGDAQEKVAPYMQPLFDNLNVIKRQFATNSTEVKRIEDMQKSEQLVIEALAFIRGRSLSEMYCIIDEAQNLTPNEIKTIITRAGEGTKMVFTGDIQQIDQPYLDSQSNGLVYMIDRMKDQNIFAHVNLLKGERSELSELASNLL